eukprot:scaffold19219_cov52-Phaeocystis_antarctica.AAC.3
MRRGRGLQRQSNNHSCRYLGIKRPKDVGEAAGCASHGSWAHAGVEVPFGPAYVPGDRIGVTIWPAGWTATKVTKATKAAREIVFFLNGKTVGVAASSLGTEELLLAVQPYMGGVALLTKIRRKRRHHEDQWWVRWEEMCTLTI